MTRYECARCETKTQNIGLPPAWQNRNSSVGLLTICPACAANDKAPERRARESTSEPAGEGHNSGNIASNDVITGAAQGRLRTIIERIERVEEDRAGLNNDLKDILAEAKGEGFDVKILKKVTRLRKMNPVAREEEEALIDLYMSAIGEA